MRSFDVRAVKAVILAILVVISMATAVQAAVYYVDATNGNDSYDGMSASTPWKTISRVNGSSFAPGDSILFKRGEMWREQLTPPSSGALGSVITFGTYGTGSRPVISGSNIVNGIPYIINDTFTGNAVRGWAAGRGTVQATNDHLEAVLDGVDNNYGDYLTRDVPAMKEGWLMYRFSLIKGYTWTKDQAVVGSGVIDGAYVGLINANGAPVWRVRVERDGGFDYYVPAAPSVQDGIWYDVKVHVKAASAAGANDGAVQVWINGALIFNLSGIDSDTKTLKKVSMGNTYYAPAGLSMRLGIDDVKFANCDINGSESGGWNATGVSGSDGSDIYQGYAFFDSSTLFENRSALKKVAWSTDLATTAARMQAGTWTIDTKNWLLYVIPSTPVLPDSNLYEASTRANSILVSGKNYTKFEGLELKNSDRESLLFMKLTGIEINDIVAHHNGCQGTNLSTVQGQTVNDVYVHDSIFRDSSWNGVSVDCYYGPSSNITIENNTIFNNIHNGIDFKAAANYTYSNLKVTGNRSYRNGTHGLYMQNYTVGGAKNATIAHNLFYRNYGAGGYIHKNFTGQEHSGIKVYGNTFAYNGVDGGFGPGVQLEAVDSDIRDNNFYTDSVTASGNSEYRINGSGNSSDFNNSFDRGRTAYLYYNGASYTFPAFRSLGFEAQGSSVNPRFNGEFTDDYTLRWDSPSIDAGVAISGISTDILGNPIYGTPDLGAFEFQPPYTMGFDAPDTASNVRIYSDGKFRNTLPPAGTAAHLVIAPSGGFTSGKYDEWMNLVINAWETSGVFEKSWRESSSTIGYLQTAHTVGDLQPSRYYAVAVDTVTGLGIGGAGCSAGICLSDAEGKISFTYNGGYNGGTHTFSVRESGTIPSCVALTNSVCYPSISAAYQSLSEDGTILVRNLSLTENLTFDKNISVSVFGGYDAGFTSKTGITTVSGSLSVTTGAVTFGSFSMK
ncbi:right-handed parallel beta-helix repeat-containing protein [Geomonas sp. RF6]|uniref:right-handed parallel beta-helix repeat-containing protein n=1 Tax=Geomonas sp. RF6 TaxID=2897342 RepID=UPI001E2DEF25|nr:right-handed parallel beta-helix repeat-containing protein [Geomonas sp. RF6]UFS70175.1 right-handed parallel beta-helix repeat-containing protein [Geomonas sp. RF6]